MTNWEHRSREEKALLNPSFCAMLLWHAATKYASPSAGALPFEESFLVLPFVLPEDVRDRLPRSTRTSLPVWIDKNPLLRVKVTSLARVLVPYTREALMFGGVYGFINIDNGRVCANPKWRKNVDRILRESSDEVRRCSMRAGFIGGWFSDTGNSATVFALMGVRP